MSETFREVAQILFGDGANELVAKFNPDGTDISTKGKKDKRARGITAGLSAVGAGAGAYGLGVGVSEVRRHGKELGSLKRGLKATPKSVKALVPLEIAGLAGEVSATRILHGDVAKPKKKVIKSADGRIVLTSDGSGHIGKATTHTLTQDLREAVTSPKRKLTQATVTNAARAGGKGIECGKGYIKKLPAIEGNHKMKKSFDVKWEGEISKINSDKQQVFGWASIVELNGEPVVDLQGDYISIDEVEKAAYDYVHKSRKGGDMHLRDGDRAVHKSDMIESLVVTSEKKAALGLPEETPTGWWVGYQVHDPELWAKVKSGERTGFSIHGRGIRTDA